MAYQIWCNHLKLLNPLNIRLTRGVTFRTYLSPLRNVSLQLSERISLRFLSWHLRLTQRSASVKVASTCPTYYLLSQREKVVWGLKPSPRQVGCSFCFGFRSTFLCFIQKKVVSLPPLLSPFPLRRRDVEYSEAYKLLDISVVTPILMQQAMKLDALRAYAGGALALLYTIRR